MSDSDVTQMEQLMSQPDERSIEEVNKEEKLIAYKEKYPYLNPPDDVKEARATLNEDQAKVFDDVLKDFMCSDDDYAVIVGYAGTGKTYLIARIIEALNGTCAMSAPTNKATSILRDAGQRLDGNGNVMPSDVEYNTIHKLLALTLRWVYPKRKGEEIRQELTKTWGANPSINNYQLLVIDEVSMLDDELFEMIDAEKSSILKIIFLGDPAQIPPVDREDSIPLLESGREKYNIRLYELTKMMRQKDGNTILETSYEIRNNRFDKVDPITHRITTENLKYYSMYRTEDKDNFIRTLLNHFKQEEYKKDINLCKVLAWTNKTVDLYNTIIRRSIYGDEANHNSLLVGEKLIINKPVIVDKSILFNISDEIELLEITEQTKTITVNNGSTAQINLKLEEMETIDFNFTYYDCLVLDVRSGAKRRIEILHAKSKPQYNAMLKHHKSRKEWEKYTLGLSMFADVKYAYAITVHKSQGSTYGTVYLIEDDVYKNRKTLEKNRILYTAITRAKHCVHSLTSRN